VHLTASVGVALEGASGATPEDLLRSADVARYAAKARGKGGFALYDESMRADALGRLDLEAELSRALARGELAVHFQPIFLLARREVVAAEALLRWNHPSRGLLSAASFLPFAQRAGILPTIDLWVLAEACRTARVLTEHGGTFSMHANLLPTRLQDAAIVDKVAAVLDETRLAGDRLVLEITESAVLFDTDSAANRLNGLRALGVRLALDDFGTGYSSLSHLRRFPVHTVKIDRMFVDGLVKDSRERALVQGLVRFGMGLGLEVIAEGIERESQLDGLVQLGCQYGQGYYLAPPLPPAQFLQFVSAKAS
jgi:EAL domain-containing protein (putative c-di-GMP-specific phosphodiesterase class I)